jgi:hypothetical protein
VSFLDRMDLDSEEPASGPFRVTPGFIAFLAALFLPAVLALAIFLGAWIVSDEVYAAEAGARRESSQDEVSFRAAGEGVPGWKRTLVDLCPAH